MRLYCADIRGADMADALMPGRRKTAGSAFGVSLLAYAVRDFWNAADLPAIGETEAGKPYFPEFPDRHFSISHTRSHVLVAVSDYPVGADVEMRRPFSEAFVGKLTTERERSDFDFFELWVLRESLFKLTGKGNLRKMRFKRENGLIVPPTEGVRCRLYGDIPDCAAAACCFDGGFPDTVTWVDKAEICT